ncbi:MAG: hypothetical protein DRK00_04195 [Thermoprotei archaeon]|nr:MAG: hypothetical protein DRK00_04195 [Thermoprotei archaeon]
MAPVVEVLVQVPREEGLERVEKVVKRVNELRANLNALFNAIKSRYSSDPRLSKLVENLLEAYRPPDPPNGDRLLELSSSLEEYAAGLERSVKILTKYAVALDRLNEELDKLEKLVGELDRWSSLLRDVAPHLSSEALKLVSRANRLLQQLPLEDPLRTLDEASITVREARRLSRVCKRVYANRVNELLSSASQLLKTLRRAARSTSMMGASEARMYEAELRKIIDRLEAALREPLEQGLSLSPLREELKRLEEASSKLLEGLLSREEEAVVRELERLARALEDRPVELSRLIEAVSRKAGLPIERAAYLLYVVEKKGFARLHVRLRA